uniref:Uncharacterized protein n=1 Tax=Poecilia reticulata TaxID=8081 RepID=A0A3P9QEF2_POERE
HFEAEHAGVFDVVDIPGQGYGNAEQKGKQPDHHTSDVRVHHGAKPPGPHRVHNGQVTVNAECREEKDARVEVEHNQSSGSLAQKPSKRPVVTHGRKGRPHGQSDDEGEIRHGEIRGSLHFPPGFSG